MDLGVFYEVIVPLMEVKGTATICISTPLGSWNFYSELTQVRDEKGRLVFNVKHIEHGKRPSWKPEETFSKVKAIFGNRRTLFEREIMGRIADAAGSAFNGKLLKRFFDNPPVDEPHDVLDNIIYVCLDPNGGANASNASGSDTAIVSFFMNRGRLVICGLDAHGTDDLEQPWELLRAHIRALRAVKCFKDCTFRLIVEANLGDQGQLLSRRAVARMTDVEIVCSHQHAYGIFTTPGIKDKYVFKLREKLHQDAVVYHKHIISVNPYSDQTNQNREQLAQATKQKFERQMRAFRVVYNVPKAIMSSIGMTYSGKADKDNQRTTRAQDDLCMTLLFGYYYYTMLTSDVRRAFIRSHRNALIFEENVR